MKAIEPPAGDVMSYRGLSLYLKFAQGTLRHWVMQGKIPYIKIGRNVRFSKKQIDAWLEKQRGEPRGVKAAKGNKGGGAGNELFAAAGGVE